MANDTTRRAFLGAVAAAGGASVACSSGLTGGSPEPALSHEAIPLDVPIPVEEVPTPALLIDVATMELNLAKMAAHAEERSIGLRPHTKTHKCPLLAKRQLEMGAVGVCCAKVGEAEVMVEAGLEEVLITSPVVTDDKIRRVVALSKMSSEVALVVDNQPAAERLNEAAAAQGVTQRVLVDLDVGTRRTGIAVGEPALELAQAIDGLPNLDLQGLQAYAGHLM
ncbi:MAG: alanine racemase, partial [Acidobacteria bacterium]|nr:alanine racemase [Acidobacteriota bacterium]